MTPARTFLARLLGWLDHWSVAFALTAALHGGLAAVTWQGSYQAPPATFSLSVMRGPQLGGAPGGSGPGFGGGGPGGGGPGDGGPWTGGTAIDMPRRGAAPPDVPPTETSEPPPTLPAAQVMPGGMGGTVPIPVDRSHERREVLSAVERQRRIREALATAGVATSGGGGGEGGGWGWGGGGGGGGGWGGGGDPALWAWQTEVESLFRESFHPIVPMGATLPAGGARYLVDFDPETGVVRGFSPYEGSGNAAYDAAVVRAIRAVPTIPLPPSQYRNLVGTRLVVEFLPP